MYRFVFFLPIFGAEITYFRMPLSSNSAKTRKDRYHGNRQMLNFICHTLTVGPSAFHFTKFEKNLCEGVSKSLSTQKKFALNLTKVLFCVIIIIFKAI